MKTYVRVYSKRLTWYETDDVINSNAESDNAEIVKITKLTDHEVMVLFRKLNEETQAVSVDEMTSSEIMELLNEPGRIEKWANNLKPKTNQVVLSREDVALLDAEVKRLQEENKELKERNKFLENELDGVSHALQTTNAEICEYMQEAEKYEKTYYDEFQKRVKLAEIVKQMEDAEDE